MRVSQGVLCGRRVQLYHPELFNEHEEVIILTREEFRRMYQSMAMQIDHITRLNMSLDRSEEWGVIGLWPKIMERIRIMDLNLENIFSKKPLQTYLDTYIYDDADLPEMVAESSSEVVTAESLCFSWSK
ncbi:hypothetical protein [Methanobacterium sp.]|uniref:hypothetical protein n=1 Tax=Methanobacterium sp. TaxID=2164 RepID=UPI002ABAAB24|nr:hypothetical protein [Methanobacterium sp.]MDY9923251.1 hypothetical protein [Methanobacterium sp.]